MLIIGGGITGLTTAYTLERETDFEITLLDRERRFGGKIQTRREDGFIVEVGPDSVFTGKPEAIDLIKEIGLEEEISEPGSAGFGLLIGSKLYPVPHGIARFAGVSSDRIDQATFLSCAGKKRALEERSVPPGKGGDESIRSFFSRRFGEEFSRLVAEPILAGTHAGDPDKLSVKALYPSYLAREQRSGCLSGESSGLAEAVSPSFLSLKGGMEVLAGRLRSRLERVSCVTVEAIGVEHIRTASPLVLTYGTQYSADHVVITVPANFASELLADQAVSTSQLLKRMDFASSQIVTAAYPRSALGKEPIGTGFLTPHDADHSLSGGTWTSQKWPGRARSDQFLARFFFGGKGRRLLDTKGELIEKARQAAEVTLGVSNPPDRLWIDEWDGAFPQYEIGHTELVDQIEQSLDGKPFSVAGSSYRGVGIPDCIRQGREAARKIAKELG